MQPGDEFPCHGNGSPDEILSNCFAQEIREMYPYTHSGKLSKNEMSGSVQQWTLVALIKRHRCTSTVWRQLTDWREQVTTWRDLRGLLYSHSDTVCLLIQSNYIELQPSINILIWIEWLFYDSVFAGTRSEGQSHWQGSAVKYYLVSYTFSFSDSSSLPLHPHCHSLYPTHRLSYLNIWFCYLLDVKIS
jgi:hypothetical protein